jgi:hypothetical protein
MDNFNFKKFLTENKLTKTSVLREGLGAYEFEEGKKKGEAEEKKTMSKSDLKQKIKEMILAELSLAEGEENNDEFEDFLDEGSDDEDYEKAGREVKYNINPETDKKEFDLKDFFMDDEEPTPETPGFKGTKDALGDLKIREAKKKKNDAPEEELDLDLGEETPEGEENLDLNLDTTDIAPAEDNFNIDTSAVDPNIKAIQDALTQAQKAAEKLQDEKLLQQINNTIMFFTRTFIANTEPIRSKTKPIRENEEYGEGVNNQYFMNDEDGWELDKSEVQDFLESRYVQDDFEDVTNLSRANREKITRQVRETQKAINDYLESDLSYLTKEMTDNEIETQMSEDLNEFLGDYMD